jgi:hypothetical protein
MRSRAGTAEVKEALLSAADGVSKTSTLSGGVGSPPGDDAAAAAATMMEERARCRLRARWCRWRWALRRHW